MAPKYCARGSTLTGTFSSSLRACRTASFCATPPERPTRSGTPARRASAATRLAPLRQANIQITADTITPSLGFVYQDLDGLLRAYCGTINGVSLERGLEMRTELCRRYRVEGVLVHYNRSCRPWCGALQETERRLGRELEVPVVSFHGDQGDPEVFSAAQFELRLDTLCELMEQKS